MSDLIFCQLDHMLLAAGKKLNKFGKDQTGTVDYQFNKQGWRSSYEYNFVPAYAFFGNSSVFGIGVTEEQRFSSSFASAHNYGLAGRYTNLDIVDTIVNFVSSKWFTPEVKMATVWTDRDEDIIKEQWHKIEQYNIQHFFCGTPHKGLPMIKQIDTDVSASHMGPKSHAFFNKVLCARFNQ